MMEPFFSIAYDHVRGSRQPEAWNMRLVLSIATVLGIVGVTESFLMFYFAEHHWHISREIIQSLLYLKLSVAGHLTVFAARVRGAFWSFRPSKFCLELFWNTSDSDHNRCLWLFMPALGWKLAAIIWIYALLLPHK